MALPGLTQEETDALRTVLSLALGRDRVSRKVREHLDGDDTALKDAPALREKLDAAAEVIRVSAAKMKEGA